MSTQSDDPLPLHSTATTTPSEEEGKNVQVIKDHDQSGVDDRTEVLKVEGTEEEQEICAGKKKKEQDQESQTNDGSRFQETIKVCPLF
jgi:hypothetical protein